ncbi:MAG: RHS repeat-associated core domain-containing protein [Bacteroidia bacterium]
MRMAGLSLVPGVKNSYLFTGKETQDELGLGWIDFGARMYDAASSRWNGVDALGEKYVGWSPYNYVMGNPLIFVDPDGRTIYDADGNKIIVQNDKKTKTLSFSTANGEKLNEGTQEILSSLNQNHDGRKLLRKLDRNSKERKLILSENIGILKQSNAVGIARGLTLTDKTGNATIYVFKGSFETKRLSEESLTEDSYNVIDFDETKGRELATMNMSKTEILELYKNKTEVESQKREAINSPGHDQSLYRKSENYKYSSLDKFVELVSYHEAVHTLPSNNIKNAEAHAVKREVRYFKRNYQK